MKTIKKKVWPEYFEKILSGEKTFEVRLGDFDIQEGDTLMLEEWNPKTKEYTGRSIQKTVTYIAKTKDLPFWSKEETDKHGYQIIELEIKE